MDLGQPERRTHNYARHGTTDLFAALLRHPRFTLHFTPTHASWLNMVERFFGLLTEHALRRGSHDSVKQLRAAIVEYIETHNDAPKPFRWTKTPTTSARRLLGSAGAGSRRTRNELLLEGITDPRH